MRDVILGWKRILVFELSIEKEKNMHAAKKKWKEEREEKCSFEKNEKIAQ